MRKLDSLQRHWTLKSEIHAKNTLESVQKERYKHATTCSSYVPDVTESQYHCHSTKHGCLGGYARHKTC